MLTLFFQSLNSICMLSFGLLAVGTSRTEAHARPAYRAAWRLVGIAFLVGGANAVVQDTFAVWAFLSGAGTPVYETFVRWAPVSNTGRASVMLGLALGLLVARDYTRVRTPHVVFLLLLMFVAGGSVFALTGIQFSSQYYEVVALLSVVELFLFLGVLLRGVLAQTMDRFLWFCLGIYAVREAWNVIWISALAWKYVPDAWYPRPWQIQAYVALTYGLILALGVYRLRLARRGVPVRALLEPKETPSYSVLG